MRWQRKQQEEKLSDWQKERTMSAFQFKKIVKQLGMTKAGAGRYIGVSPRTLRRIVAGQSKVDAAQALLLRSLVAHNEKPVVPKWERG
jgi:DNA-binding transcriptional regulator YiaG